ncbi:MAG: hypothetical protein QOF49_1133 [Chloroflexota bacterium]|jgi:hypothetical protein|nr:hypothetical protein [Chloroflexota bacterium]
MDHTLAERLGAVPDRLAIAARGARTEAAPGEWGPLDIVRHLIAVEREVWPGRLAQLAAEDHPRWEWIEPGLWGGEPAATLDRLLELFRADRASTLAIVDGLPPDARQRHGTHATFGELDLAGLLAVLLDHDEQHLASLNAGARAGAGAGARDDAGDGGRAMDRTERSALIDRFRTGAADVEAALAGITADELDRPPAETGSWTARAVVHHLADSEAMAYIRLRRLIAEDRPTIAGYDEPEWARRLHYDRPIASSVAVLVAVRAASLELLEVLDDVEWDRAGTHSESGRYGVDDWLRIYAEHSHEHAAQIRAARAG